MISLKTCIFVIAKITTYIYSLAWFVVTRYERSTIVFVDCSSYRMKTKLFRKDIGVSKVST